MAFLNEIFGQRIELPDGSHIDGLVADLAEAGGVDAVADDDGSDDAPGDDEPPPEDDTA